MKKIETNILPLAISVLLILISFGISISSNKVFTTEHYVGSVAVSISLILYFTNRKIYFLFFALTLTIGLIGFLDFYITSYKVGFAGVGVNPIFLGLLILFFAISKEQMDKLSPEKRTDEKPILDENLVKSFETKFLDKTVAELKEITDENSKFTDAAKTAAKRILEKKNVL